MGELVDGGASRWDSRREREGDGREKMGEGRETHLVTGNDDKLASACLLHAIEIHQHRQGQGTIRVCRGMVAECRWDEVCSCLAY